LLAKIAVDQKQYSRARTYLTQALKLLGDYRFQTLFYEIAESVAQLCSATRRSEDAVVLYTFAAEYLDKNLASRIVSVAPEYANRFEPLKKVVGLERFDWLAEKGKHMSHTEVYDLALLICENAGDGTATSNAETIFTERELDVLRLLAQGKTNEEISAELVIVLKTAEKHIASIFRKLGVKNRTEAAAWALENGVK
jgi:DNA-binding CsgD family transcriptional regulator